MAATVQVREINGAGAGSPTVVTNIRHCTADDNNPGTANPIPIVSGATKYGYWKSIELYLSGTYTRVDNIYFYTDGGGFGTGITTYVGDEVLAAGSYEQATGTAGDTGDELVATHTGITAETDVFTYTSGAMKTFDAGPYTTPSERTKHMCFQMKVVDTASAGTLTAETWTFRYDEV